MNHSLKLTLLFIVFVGSFSNCTSPSIPPRTQIAAFERDIEALKEFFEIPGLSYAVYQHGKAISKQSFGYSDLDNKIPVNENTLFPLASLTKLYTACLIMKLAEDGQFSLKDSISKFLPRNGTPNVRIEHLLSHTSEGIPGQKFHYSSRFGWLTSIIEMASKQPFDTVMEDSIIIPLGLKHTFLSKYEGYNPTKYQVALPYKMTENGSELSKIELGFSASGGMVATVDDFYTFQKDLFDGNVISDSSLEKISSPFGNGLPYGMGMFTQTIHGKEIKWAYGQMDSYSSLWVYEPEQDISLIVLANSNLMSDPARLINGDLSSSLFAQAFLQKLVLRIPKNPILTPIDTTKVIGISDSFERERLLSQALAESFMARFKLSHYSNAVHILESVLAQFPEITEYGTINTLHTMTFLNDVAFFLDLEPPTQFNNQIEELGEFLLKEDPQNPYINVYLGIYFDRQGKDDRARKHFQSIVDARNFSRNWYTEEAENWLKNRK